MALFKKKPAAPLDDDSPKPPRVEWDLEHVVSRVRDAAPVFEARDIEVALLHARLADHYRDLELVPPEAAEFERTASDLDVEGWRRLAVAVATLDDTGLRAALAARAPWMDVSAQVQSGFLELARDIAPMTVALMRQSTLRAEEFARNFACASGLGSSGKAASSLARGCMRLDYKRLLAEAEQAKAAAHEKMERLRKRQLESDLRRRRGKF